ncbi:macro domain-containing protein [Megamonas hypermegale]|uniref:macro domain-containing protein n=1 Tax=Megamonas hypermegale TaxID=158847 RepID=UPI0037C5D726
MIINFPTKIHWKNSSQLSFIDKGLDALILAIYKYDIKSISIPMLGYGLGQLKKEDVHLPNASVKPLNLFMGI